MKKSVLVLLIFVTIGQISFSQIQVKYPVLKEINIGEPMPDIPLGNVMNNTTGKTKFSEFRGKLVILDFWLTTCTSCIAGFPYLSELQKEFGDKIQIFLVNPLQTEEDITKQFSKLSKTMNTTIPANLPVIVNARDIYKLFPSRGVIGYQGWIDGNGVVRLRGGSENCYPEKIKELLAGREITFIKDQSERQDVKKPFYSLIQNATKPVLQYSSTFGNFTDEIATYCRLVDIVDSAAKTIRSTYLDVPILDQYQIAAKNQMEDNRVIWGPRLILNVKDTSQFTFLPPWHTKRATDKDIRKSSVCYEQVTPLGLSESTRRQYMLEDLNRYIGSLYGAEGKVEKRKMPCYILVRTSKVDKIKTKGGDQYIQFPVVNGKKNVVVTNYELKSCFNVMRGTLEKVFTLNGIFLDETNYANNVDISLPYITDIKSLEDLRKALNAYDLDIIKEEREVNMLVIKDKEYTTKNN